MLTLLDTDNRVITKTRLDYGFDIGDIIDAGIGLFKIEDIIGARSISKRISYVSAFVTQIEERD